MAKFGVECRGDFGVTDAMCRRHRAVPLIVRVVCRRFRMIEGFGLGDLKLAVAGAVWLAWRNVLFETQSFHSAPFLHSRFGCHGNG
jgi:hypothetical protein